MKILNENLNVLNQFLSILYFFQYYIGVDLLKYYFEIKVVVSYNLIKCVVFLLLFYYMMF